MKLTIEWSMAANTNGMACDSDINILECKSNKMC